jgi:membrane protein required for colicin V production
MEIGIGWVDGVMLGVLVLSLVVGALRGLVFEVLALLGWVVAWFVAQWATPWLAVHLPIGTPGSLLNRGAAFASAFIAALIVWGLLSRLVRSLVHATPLRAVDRLMGAAFGLLRGVIVLLAIAVLVAYTPAARSPDWRASVGAGWLTEAWRGVKPMLPSDVSNLLRV